MKHFVLLVLITFCLAHTKDAIVPPKFSLVTFAIKQYENNWQKELPLALKTANALVNSFKSNLSSNYPNVTYLSKQYENSQVTKERFEGSETNDYNFVFYNGHGRVNAITMWKESTRVFNTSKSFGGKTYWVMLNSCLVFKNGESNQEPWFNGVHSILGYSSQSIWFSKSYRCGVLNLKTCHRYSYYTERDFASNWIKGKQGIWESFKNAVSKNILKEGGYGVEPKIVYRYGNVDGKFFDPWEETFENSIQKPVFKKTGEYTGIASIWVTMGTPKY